MTDTYELEMRIDAPRERVWRALTDARELERWFCEHADVSVADGRFAFWGRLVPDAPTASVGRLIDVEPERRLRFAWRFRGAGTTVEITLSDDTAVHVLHAGVPQRTQGGGHTFSHFWGFALEDLKAMIEVGRTAPRFDYSWPHKGGFAAHAKLDATPAEVFAEEARRWTASGGRLEDGFSYVHPAGAGVKLLDVRPGEGWSMEWNELDPPLATVMTYTLAASGGGTRLTIIHSGFGPDDDIQGMATGFFTGVRELAWAFLSPGWLGRSRARVRVLREPRHDPPRSAERLADLMRGRTDAELRAFVEGWGGIERVAYVLLSGLCDRIEPREDCVVGFSVGADFAVRVAAGSATLEREVPADAEAVVRMSPVDFLRAAARDAFGEMTIAGDGEHGRRLFSMVRGRVANAR